MFGAMLVRATIEVGSCSEALAVGYLLVGHRTIMSRASGEGERQTRSGSGLMWNVQDTRWAWDESSQLHMHC
jgi:uncharacterized protein YceK